MALPKGAGDLKERVKIIRLVRAPDSMGGKSSEYEDLGTFFAQVNITKAEDNVLADQMRDLRTHEVILRKGTIEIKQGYIVQWQGENLDVKATRIIANWLILDCMTRIK